MTDDIRFDELDSLMDALVDEALDRERGRGIIATILCGRSMP
jgi:hypothetical protein